MSGANPVETKTDPAAALNPPTPGQAAKAGWPGRTKLGLVVGGAALVLAGGWYGLTHFRPGPPPAVAQSKEPAPEPAGGFASSADPAKRPEPGAETLPEIKVPAVSDIKVPATRPADLDLTQPPPLPTPDGDAKRPGKPGTGAPPVEAPPIPSDPTKDKADTAPPLLLPDAPVPEPDKKKTADPDKAAVTDPTKKPEDDLFKAPGGLADADRAKVDGVKTGPAPTVTDVKPPVITTGGTDNPMPPKPDPDKKADPMGPPPVPTLDITPPAPPKPDPDKKSDLPPLLIPDKPDGDKPDSTKPPAVTPPKPDAVKPDPGKKDEPPTLVIPKRPATGPAPAADSKKDEPPSLPKIDVTAPDPVKAPPVTADPPAPPAIGPMPPAVGGPADPKKKDMYDEDWHTPRSGDTFVTISQEYYHEAKYAAALEAYNKDRRKADDKIIRVPPPWVLKEQFPNLAPKDDDKSAGPEAKPTGNIKFEPAAPVAPIATSRPAPPPAGSATTTAPAGPSDEYRVLAKEGESIREIAQKVLGSQNAWRKLWDLNPDVDPTQPIPVGTTLRVPRSR